MIIEKENFGNLPSGAEVCRYILKNKNGMEVRVMDYGATITNLFVPGAGNQAGDVVLGFDRLEDYLGDQPYFGAICGRYCNRIGGSAFDIDGTVYRLSANEGPNHLHGGFRGFDKQMWKVHTDISAAEASLVMIYESRDGEEGYPGNLTAEVVYSLNENNELGITCRARTDRPTHVNLTNHSYFNLNNCRGTIHRHELSLAADRYTVLDGQSIPTGEIAPVEGTPYDFRRSRPLGKGLAEVEPGYDLNYVLSMGSRELTQAAMLHDPDSGRTMEVLTTLPGIQLYTSNYVKGIRGKEGIVYEPHSAVCLETQFFPDTPNQKAFPSTLLKPGGEFTARTVFRFSN
ncbi:MAG TPA: galactose mutarotase [Bacteroides sp.]|nr:galactose mutarotase [Bacteroides sp.]